jgi:hypothetical protein
MVLILAISAESARRHQLRGRGDVERAGAERAEHLADVVLRRGGDDQDRARRGLHDPAGRLDAVHVRHVQVHQHQVGAVAGAQAHRLGAVARHPQHLVLAAGRDRPAQRLGGHRDIVGDPDLHRPGSPIRSSTASSRASSWKLPLAR